jgi:hypothetical protein
MTSNRLARGSRTRERGMAMIWSMAASLMVGGLILAATEEMRTLNAVSDAEFSAAGQAQSVAEAGLVDAYAWFRRQTVQPVSTFAPRRDMTADPAINETDDPTIGLVREFPLSSVHWARYEVRKGKPAESWTDANNNGFYDAGEAFADADGDGRWTPSQGTRDVTAERGLPGIGAVWLVESIGRVYRRPRMDLPLGEGPNRQIAATWRQTEVRRMSITLPASAAILASDGEEVQIGSRTRIRTNTVAVAYKALSGLPLLGGLLSLLGLGGVTTAAISPWNDQVTDVFGLDWTELRTIADISTSDPSSLPADLPEAVLAVITGDVVFDQHRPLRGKGVIIVKGNVTINTGSNSFFAGLLYVDGDITIRAPAYIQGTVLGRNGINIQGTGGDYVEIAHDPEMLSKLMTTVGQYRYMKNDYEPLPRLSDGRPDQTFETFVRGGRSQSRGTTQGL